MAKAREHYIVDENGKRTAVVMPIKEFQRLLEDLHDLTVVAERRDEPTISLDELRRRLRADGLIRD